jgi:hypothetical protein
MNLCLSMKVERRYLRVILLLGQVYPHGTLSSSRLSAEFLSLMVDEVVTFLGESPVLHVATGDG